MKKSISFRLIVALLIAWVWIGYDCPNTFAGQAADKKEYVCPPCGCDKDGQTFNAEGTCASCGMRLVEKGSAAARPMQPQPQVQRRQVAILIFDGVQIIDYTGPYEVFGQAGFNVFTVAEKPDQITTAMGMKVTPSFTIDNCPAPNILVIPGGGVTQTQNNQTILKWIQDTSKKSEYVMSVCNGAYILARTGLLDGLTATTFHGLIEGLKPIAPKTKIVNDRRFVDNGKIITTAGLSPGIDGSLHLISKIFGRGRAQMIALNLEYNWQPDVNYARAALADMRMRFNYAGVDGMPLSREGSRDQWENRWLVRGQASAADLLELINKTLTGQGKWTKLSTQASNTSLWKFTDDEGKPWNGAASVQPLVGEKNRFLMSVKIARDGLKDMAAADADNIIVKDAWIQEAPPAATATAAFMVIENRGNKEISLISAKADIANATELHKMETVNDVMSMRRVYLIPVAAAGSTSLDSSTGYHVMFINLTTKVKEGDRIPLTLQFSNSVQKTVLVPIKKRAESVAAGEKTR